MRCTRSRRCNVGVHMRCPDGGCACPCHGPGGSFRERLRRGDAVLGRMRYELRHCRELSRAGKLVWRVELRAWYWRFVKRYECEICEGCGCGLALRYGASSWGAPDELWLEVMGSAAGVLCVRCFTDRCDDLGIWIRWAPVVRGRRRASGVG